MTDTTPNIADIGNEDLRVETTADRVVTTATIDRPSVRNAMNPDVAAGLHEAVAYADEAPTRVLVLRGAEGTFCSGGDLGEMDETPDVTTFRERFSILTDLAGRLADADALVVAAVEGYCLAGGMGLAAACDFVVSADDATFGTPEIDVGLFPMQAMAPIMRSTHMKRGLDLLFTGEFVDADEASDLGLVTRIFDADRFEAELADFVDTLANKSPLAISMGKRGYYTQREMPYREALEYLRESFAVLASSESAREGLAAFEADREPEWSR